MQTEELMLMDYSTGEVHIYKIAQDLNVDYDYIKNVLGFNPDECAWMFHDYIDVIRHREILK